MVKDQVLVEQKHKLTEEGFVRIFFKLRQYHFLYENKSRERHRCISSNPF